MMVVFATLESAFAFCVGCKIFAGLMTIGVVPAARLRGVRPSGVSR